MYRAATITIVTLIMISQTQAQTRPESEGCMAAFLNQELGSDETALMQQVWALDHNINGSTAAFYDQHGRLKIDGAVAKFIGVRAKLHHHCPELPELMLE